MYEQGKPLKFAGIQRRSLDLQKGLTPAVPLEISPATAALGNTRVTYFSRLKPSENPIISCSGHFLSKRNKQWWNSVWNFGVIDNKRETQDLRPGRSDFKAHECNRTPHAFTCFDFSSLLTLCGKASIWPQWWWYWISRYWDGPGLSPLATSFYQFSKQSRLMHLAPSRARESRPPPWGWANG